MRAHEMKMPEMPKMPEFNFFPMPHHQSHHQDWSHFKLF
jgi:hypothetical protein